MLVILVGQNGQIQTLGGGDDCGDKGIGDLIFH